MEQYKQLLLRDLAEQQDPWARPDLQGLPEKRDLREKPDLPAELEE